MRDLRWFPLTVMVVGLGCSGPKVHSYSINMNKVSADNHKCGSDAVRTGEFTAKGEPIRYWQPCWDYTKTGPRYQVTVDKPAAAKLASIESTQCIGLSPDSLERSPFAQDQAIDEIIPDRDGNGVSGAFIVFKQVPALTVSWMRRAISCHRGRWNTLGRPSTYLTGDPTLIEGAQISVSEFDHHIVVRIQTESVADAKLVLARAYDLLEERTAVK